MSVNYATLGPEDLISDRYYTLDDMSVIRYTTAVGDESGLKNADGRLVPPMAVAALGLRGVVEDLQIPGGTLHTGQELEFLQLVIRDSVLHCQAVVMQNSVRRDRRFLVVGLTVTDEHDSKVLIGKSTLVIPT